MHRFLLPKTKCIKHSAEMLYARGNTSNLTSRGLMGRSAELCYVSYTDRWHQFKE
jgi:hypothetical protein